MRQIFLYILFFMLGSYLSAADLTEEKGYYTSPKSVYNGVVYTDNYCSKLYYTFGTNSVELFSSPGCGRYYTVSPDKKYIGFKIINTDGLQQPAIYDLENMQLIRLYRPVKKCGQVSFGNNIISFTIGEYLHILENGSQRKVALGTYANIAPVSPDNKYVIFNDNNDQLWIQNLESSEKEKISDNISGYFYPQWSPDGMNMLYSSIGGNLKIYNLLHKNVVEVGPGLSPSWSDEGQFITFYRKEIENMKLVNSDLYEYSLAEKKLQCITSTDDVSEMDPSYADKEIIYHTYELGEIKVLRNTLSKQGLFKTSPVSISFYSIPSVVTTSLDMPYVHQVYDTPDWFNGHAACGPATAMNILAYYKVLPVWETYCSTPKAHINNWGRYIAEKYNFKAVTYNYSANDPNETASYGGYGYMWNGSKSPHSTMVNYYKNHGLSASLTDQPPHSEAVSEIQNGYPYSMCVALTSAGHIVAAHGFGEESHTLVVNDPYGNKNTPGYPSYDGKDAKYDWPGYNNGFQNFGIVYWSVKTHGSFPEKQDSILDDLSFSDGFTLNTKSPVTMSTWKDLNRGFNGHMWFAYTKNTGKESCFAIWKPDIKNEGFYEVSAFVSLSNSEAAVYTVKHEYGVDTLILNQKEVKDNWLTLGRFWFAADNSNYIKLSDISIIKDQELAFDAIKYILLDTTFTDVQEQSLAVNFRLEQNYPNPFNPVTKIIYTIPEGHGNARVLITVYNLLGEKVAVLVNDYQSAGTYSIPFNASALSGGIYYYMLQTNNHQLTKKMVYLP